MGKGVLKVTSKELMDALLLEGYDVVDVRFDAFHCENVIQFCVRHKNIPEPTEGAALPLVLPVYKKIFEEKMKLEKVDIVR